MKHHRLNKIASADPIPPETPENPQPTTNPRDSDSYRSKFPPGTQFLPLNHPIPAFRGLAIPHGWNPQAYLPILPKKFPNPQ